jgi:hypothetical protein
MAEKTQKQGRGCFFYGAITLVIVFIGVAAGTYFGIRKGFLTGIETYTSTSPTPIPRLQISPKDKERIARNVATQAKQVSSGPGELVLDEQELNVFLTQLLELEAYREQIYVEPEGDKLKAHLSVPLAQFEIWKSVTKKLWTDPGNRYLNGTAFLHLGVTNGAVALSLSDFEANGKKLPDEFTKLVSNNFALAANKNIQVQETLQRVEGITVQGGKVHIRFKK